MHLSNLWLKAVTLGRVVQRIRNWPEVVRLRTGRGAGDPLEIRFRDGFRLACRRETEDWSVVAEIALGTGYRPLLDAVRAAATVPTVVDLGANIGVFSLVAARANPRAVIHAYEPAPANLRAIETNLRLNPGPAGQITVHPEAAGGVTRMAQFKYDATNAPGSALAYGAAGNATTQVRAISEIIARVGGPIDALKMDIEGAEYEVFFDSPPDIWKGVWLLSVEVHDDPLGTRSREQLLDLIKARGFTLLPFYDVPSVYCFARGGQGDSCRRTQPVPARTAM